MRTRKLEQFSAHALGVDDDRELGEALLPLAERLEQGIDDLGRRRRELKQAPEDRWANRDYGRVRERHELLIGVR